MLFRKSCGTVFEEFLNTVADLKCVSKLESNETVADLKCLSKLESNEREKLTSPRKIPEFSDSALSS